MDSRLREPIDSFDDAVDAAFEPLRSNPVANRVFYTASELGDFSLIWHILGLAKGLGPAGLRSAVELSAALGVESALVNGPIKSLFRRGRPVVDQADRPHNLRQPRTSSFPSGHASSATMAAILLGENSRWAPAYAATAVIVATSRIHVRIHHGSDVIGGAVIGAALGVAARAMRRRVRSRFAR